MHKAPSMWTYIYKHKTYWTTRPCQVRSTAAILFCSVFVRSLLFLLQDRNDRFDLGHAETGWAGSGQIRITAGIVFMVHVVILLHAIILARKNWSRESRWKLSSKTIPKHWQKQWTKSNMAKVKHMILQSLQSHHESIAKPHFCLCWNEGQEDGTEQPQIESNASCYKLTLAFSTFEPHRKKSNRKASLEIAKPMRALHSLIAGILLLSPSGYKICCS